MDNQHQPSTSAASSSTASCPECGGTGFILSTQVIENYMGTEESGEVMTARECVCARIERIKRMIASSLITEQFRSLRLTNFETEGRPEAVAQAHRAAKHYLDNFKALERSRNNSLLLLGNPGCGKTHLVCAVANELLDAGVATIYFQHTEGFSKLKDASREGALENALERLRSVAVLVWDDLFKPPKNPTDFELETFFGVINYRYMNNLPLLISSEKTPQQLLEIDQATGSRLIEMGKGHIVVLQGDPMKLNYRLR